MNRRKFMTLVGGGIVVAAGATTGAGLLMREPTAALAPWRSAGDARYVDARLRALSFAILAPNPHNMQPWQVELVGTDEFVLTVDAGRLLPHTDPFSRQITIGLGCFLELMALAAAETGHRLETAIFPAGADAERLTADPVATVRFVADETVRRDPLFAHTLDRRSLKEPFDVARTVPAPALDTLRSAAPHGSAVGGTIDAAEVAFWRDLTADALRVEFETPHTYKESVDVLRIGRVAIEATPDGIDLSGPLVEFGALMGQLDRDDLLDPASMAFRQGLESSLAAAQTAMGHVWLVSGENSRAAQIAAGRDWLRINLAATGLGIGLQPLSQALQEYPEMAAPYEETHRRLAPGGGTVQMLARLGYGPEVPASPRWPLEAKLKDA
jgi:hypothetical protein